MYGLLSLACLFIVIVKPIANLLSDRNPGREAAESGAAIFDEQSVNGGYQSANYIMLFLFGSLCLVFLWRAIRTEKSQPKEVQSEES